LLQKVQTPPAVLGTSVRTRLPCSRTLCIKLSNFQCARDAGPALPIDPDRDLDGTSGA
jgi:hypothetical protein